MSSPDSKYPICSICSSTESWMWTRNEEDGTVNCHNCFDPWLASRRSTVESDTASTAEAKPSTSLTSRPSSVAQEEPEPKMATRKSMRITRSAKSSTLKGRSTATAAAKPKGKSRRFIFKEVCYKSPSAVATPVTSSHVFYRCQYYSVGDIVSCTRVDGGRYYAQLRGFITDQYCEKSAVLTWLIPTDQSPANTEEFDPSTYVFGMEEDIPRRLSCFEFVMHAPSDYFKSKSSPYPPVEIDQTEGGYIWTRLKTKQTG